MQTFDMTQSRAIQTIDLLNLIAIPILDRTFSCLSPLDVRASSKQHILRCASAMVHGFPPVGEKCHGRMKA